MYGLKKEMDLSFLNGRELIQIAVGLYHISFRFDEDVAISVEGEFRYFNGRLNGFGSLSRVQRKLQPRPCLSWVPR
jgi:hypothetical protein